MRSEKGFSLIELLIVVAIIGIIAAIAIPNFTQSKMAANEAAAISTVRTLVTAQFTYAATVGNGQFADALATLGGTTPPLIDEVLQGGSRSGYDFTVELGSEADSFLITAAPSSEGITGTRTFTADQSGVLRDEAGNVIGQAALGS